MLTPPELAHYLLRHDLIQPQVVVAGDLVIEDTTRRHANIKVISAGGPSYLVKQGVGAARAAGIAHEAAVYQLLQEAGAGRALARYLPRFYEYHADEALLVLELLPSAREWGAYHQRWGRFSTALAAALGTALGTLHQTPQPATRPLPVRPPPAILSIQRPTLALYQEISHANLQLIQTLQRFPPFGQHLDVLRQAWQPSALVHYDLKGDNLLVVPAAARQRATLKIVDWESAGWGDPCWDVGSVLGEYLGCWLTSIPFTGADPPEQLLTLARFPLAKMQPAIRRFWQSYSRRMGLDAETTDQWLLRAVRYSAARLLQTAFEQSQTAATLSGRALNALQLSYNILQRPHEAAIQLLGLAWRQAGA